MNVEEEKENAQSEEVEVGVDVAEGESETVENEVDNAPETSDVENDLTIAPVVIPNNKNFLIGYIYNQTSDISENRILLKYREVVREQLLESKSKLTMQIEENPETKRDIRERNEEIEKKIKVLEKREETNEEEVEKLEGKTEAKCHLVEMAQLVLVEAKDYETPVKI